MAKNGQAYDNKSGQWLGSLVASSGADGTIMVNIKLRMKKSIIIKGLVCSFVRPLFCPLAMLCHTNWFLFLFSHCHSHRPNLPVIKPRVTQEEKASFEALILIISQFSGMCTSLYLLCLFESSRSCWNLLHWKN